MSVAAMFWMGLSGSVGAQTFDDVVASKHNLAPNGAKAQADKVCVACHTMGQPTNVVPLWDKRNTTKAFKTQYNLYAPTEKANPETKPFGPSFECLACHDGVLGSNVHQLGFSGSGPTDHSNGAATIMDGRQTPDHPDSIIYPRQPDGRFASNDADPRLKRYWSIPDRNGNGVVLPTGPSSAALNLQSVDPNDPVAASALVRTYLGAIHCDSCHNPHSDQVRPFLRVPHKTLCTVCHDR